MSDLIRKSETIDLLYQVFEKYSMATDKNDPLSGFGAELFKNIKAMPIAFDVDKVVEELEAEQQKYTAQALETDDIDTVFRCAINEVAMQTAIEIVKRGGKE